MLSIWRQAKNLNDYLTGAIVNYLAIFLISSFRVAIMVI